MAESRMFTAVHGPNCWCLGLSMSNGQGHMDWPFPMGTDVLVTHMLPQSHPDIAGFGDKNLLKEMRRTRPRLHVFKHVHRGYGRDYIVYDSFEAWHEDICRGIGGFPILEKMFYCPIQYFWSSRAAKGTDLINTAAIVGMKDTERRRPSVVQLGLCVSSWCARHDGEDKTHTS